MLQALTGLSPLTIKLMYRLRTGHEASVSLTCTPGNHKPGNKITYNQQHSHTLYIYIMIIYALTG